MRETLFYFAGSRARSAAQRGLRLWLSLTLLALLSGFVASSPAQAQVSKDLPLGPRINTSLARLYQQYTQDMSVAVRQGTAPAAVVPNARFAKARGLQVKGNYVLIRAIADGSADKLANSIRALGGTVTGVYKFMVSAYVPVGSLGQMANLTTLRCALPSYKYKLRVGAVTSQGDRAMKTDRVRQAYGLDGSGIKVGVLSDSFNTSGNGSYATDIATGDLPPGLQVVHEAQRVATDEGRGMLQIVHDVAPGSPLAFSTGDGGDAAFAQNIKDLQSIGCKVIVDDLGYLDEPFFADGVVAQAVNAVVAAGAVYTSSAGNDARQSYESAFRTGMTRAANSIPVAPTASITSFRGGTTHNFATSGAVTDMQSFTLDPGDEATLVFQWEDSYLSAGGQGATQDLDFYILNAAGTQVLEGSTDNNIGQDPLEFIDYVNTGNATTTYNLMIVQHSTGTPPRDMKYIDFTDGLPFLGNLQFATNSGTCYGHPNAAGALACAAAWYVQTPVFGQTPPLVESFSSAGGTAIYRDAAGNPIAPITRQKPNVTAPDGVSTSFFGQPDTDIPPDGFPNFFGTSAAAPHAGALAALMLQANPRLTPATIDGALQSTAINIGPAGFDFDSGYGLVDGLAAVAAVAIPDTVPPTVTITSPTNNALVTAIPQITGTAFDVRNDGTPGTIAAVNVAIIRNSDGTYYNGTTFSNVPTTLPATVNANGTWVLQNVALPTGANLLSGTYSIVASAIDANGNVGTNSVTINVDDAGPTVTITNPVDATIVTSISSITGQAIDNTGGSGVASVNVTLVRNLDGAYWNGTSWLPVYAALPTTLNADGTFAVSAPLPGAQLINSNYTITAIATDNLGNVNTAVIVVTVNSGLGVSFTTPEDGGYFNDFSAITGRYVEGNSGPGVTQVYVTIRRASDGLYYNAGVWSVTPFNFPTTLNADGTFTLINVGLPPATGVLGVYNLTAYAVDAVGNIASSTITATLDGIPPVVTINTPVDKLATHNLPAIGGVATDVGSGVDHVALEIINPVGGYWNGSIYTEAPSSITAQLSGSRYIINSVNNTLPTGKNLPDGVYTLTAIAYDRAGNATSVSHTIIIDNTNPLVPTILTPINHTLGVRFGTISGRVSDNKKGSGIQSVTVAIQRLSDGLYLTRNGVSSAKVGLPATLSGNGLAFNLTSGLPTGGALQDGTYSVTVTATDKAGNSATSAAVTFTLDRTAPTLTFTLPPLNAAVKTLTVVRGTVNDSVKSNGSGVKTVTLYLLRRSDGKYWTGSAWSATKTPLTTTVSGTSWTRRGGLPSGKNLLDGAYLLQAQAVDKVGNVATLNNNIVVDNVAPAQVTITTPANGAKLNVFTSISGSASDNKGGSGIERVDLIIRRGSDKKYWTGSAWSATRTVLATRLTGTTWRYVGTLPSTLGTVTDYTLTATALDRVGASLTTTSVVTVGITKTTTAAASATPIASRLALSNATVSAAQSSAQLRFGGALDSDTASDASHYGVTVNGHAATVESAGYNAATHTVVLALPEGTLQSGDTIVVAWDGVLDTQGALLHSQVGPLGVR